MQSATEAHGFTQMANGLEYRHDVPTSLSHRSRSMSFMLQRILPRCFIRVYIWVDPWPTAVLD